MFNLRNYTVYFEIYGKKMKTNILANSVEDAQEKVRDKITFHKTIVDENDKSIIDELNDIIKSWK